MNLELKNGKAKVTLNNAVEQMSNNIEKLKLKRKEALTPEEKKAIDERINQLIMTLSYVTKSKQKRKTIKNITVELHKDIEDAIDESPINEGGEPEKIDRKKIGKGISYYQPDLEYTEQEKKEIWDLIENTPTKCDL